MKIVRMLEDLNKVHPREYLEADLSENLKKSKDQKTYISDIALADIIFEALGSEHTRILIEELQSNLNIQEEELSEDQYPSDHYNQDPVHV